MDVHKAIPLILNCHKLYFFCPNFLILVWSPVTLSFTKSHMIAICSTISQPLWNKADSAFFHGCFNAQTYTYPVKPGNSLLLLTAQESFCGSASPSYSHACVCLHTAARADGAMSSIFIDPSAVTLTLTPGSCPALCDGSIETLTAAAQPQSRPIIEEAGKDGEEASSCHPHASNLHSETHALKERRWEWNICPVMGVS